MDQTTLPGTTVVQTLWCMAFLLYPSISNIERMLRYSGRTGNEQIHSLAIFLFLYITCIVCFGEYHLYSLYFITQIWTRRNSRNPSVPVTHTTDRKQLLYLIYLILQIIGSNFDFFVRVSSRILSLLFTTTIRPSSFSHTDSHPYT